MNSFQRAGQKAAQTHRRNCRRFDIGVLPVVVSLSGQGLSWREVAQELTLRGYRSRRGGAWHPRQVGRVLKRAQASPAIELDDDRLGIIRRRLERPLQSAVGSSRSQSAVGSSRRQ
jgi:hypothetical protein